MESFEQTVSADNLTSQGASEERSATAASMTEAGGRENLAAEAEAVAVSVLSSVLGAQASTLESPNDNETHETLSPLLEVVDNLEEDKEMKDSYRERNSAGNLNLKDSLRSYSNNDNRASSLDVVSLASTLASDLAHLVETINLADRPAPGPAASGGNANINRNGRPITARTMVPDNGRFSKLDFAASDLSAELNLAFGDSIGSTPTPPPTCQVFSTPTPPPNCPPPPPPAMNNQNYDNTMEDQPAPEVISFVLVLLDI